MYTIQNLPHTADLRIKVEATDLEDLFRGALEGMCRILWDVEKPEPIQKDQLKLLITHAPDATVLLIDFLSEVLTLTLSKKTLFREMRIVSMDEYHLDCIIIGSKVEGFDDDIKAVTYHEAEVVQNGLGNWETLVVFDI
jgi:SHS2 domain-containing protein